MEIDPNELSGGERYRLMISAVVPRPIAFVSTLDESGVTNLAPFSYFNVVAGTPPLVILSIGRRTWDEQRVDKDTRRLIEETGQFVVSIASVDLVGAVNDASADYPPGVSEIDALGLTAVPSRVVRPPRVAECKIALECERRQTVPLGETGANVLIIGEVVHVHVDDDVWDSESRSIDPRLLHPLARLGIGRYATLGDVIELARPEVPKSG